MPVKPAAISSDTLELGVPAFAVNGWPRIPEQGGDKR